jgi:Secretion system C-terminal sorting domain/YHYH protein
MKNLPLLLLFLCCNFIFAHTVNPDNSNLRLWKFEKQNTIIEGSFSMMKNGKVYIEDANNVVSSYPISCLSKIDQEYANNREAAIVAMNNNFGVKKATITPKSFYIKYGFLVFFLILLTTILFKYSNKRKLIHLLPIVGLGTLFSLFGFAKKAFSTTDPAFVATAFAPFASTVSTTYDATYFYVNSAGIGGHTMMVGISNHGWQQQVPMAKCFINTSHWSIPLNPVVAATPVPVNAINFIKGALAIAANGVPIFNPYTNTGVDALLDGQLDNYGGHCGRGDDYHYHTAPLHLITLGQTTSTLPIAFALDGYAVYGPLEPTGATMATLDANHGHYLSGVYHYHGTATAPYMVGNMVGVVTQDSNFQIIPQPQGTSPRPGPYGPLTGALITACVANASNGYNTAYSLSGVTGYATNYTATAAGVYTFNYVTPTGTTTTNYNGSALCTVPNLLASEKFTAVEQNIKIYPNPATDILKINLGDDALQFEVQNISIYDIKGSLMTKTIKFEPILDIKNLSKGTYFVKIQFSNSIVTKKMLVK